MNTTSRTPRSHGAVIIGVLICLVAAAGLFAAMLGRLSLQRQEVRQQERLVQTRWLAESALDRAAARLAHDSEYRGETWNIAADAWGRSHDGVVRIVVTRDERPSARVMLEVVTETAVGKRSHVRISKQIGAHVHPKERS